MKRKRRIKQEAEQSELRILAIDPASLLGWAISNTSYGVWDLKTRKDESMGMKLIRMKAKIIELYSLTNFNVLAYERPAGRHANSIIHQAKLIAVLEQWCEENKVQYRSYSATEIKKYATGKGNSGKPAMIQAAKERWGYIGDDDNEADALHILNLCKSDLGIK